MTLILPRRKLLIGLGAAVCAPAIICAQVPMTGGGRGAPGGASPPTPSTTWNPADANGNLSFSLDNLTVTQSVPSFGSVRSIASHSTGKYYWEDTLVNSINGTAGIANSTFSLTNFVGQDNNGIGYFPSGGIIFLNTVTVASVQTSAVGDIVGYAVDMGNLKFWVRTIHLGVAGNWNNSGTDNPVTNTGGASFSTMAAGPYFAALALNGNGSQVTTDFGATPFAAPAPAGFGNP